MVRLAVFYKAPDEADKFEKRYVEGHLPLIQQYPNVKDISFSKVTRTVAGEVPYSYVFTGTWADWDSLKSDLNSDLAREAGEDAKSFAPPFDVVILEDLV